MIQLVLWELTAIYLQWLTGERLFKKRCLSGIGYLYVVELINLNNYEMQSLTKGNTYLN